MGGSAAYAWSFFAAPGGGIAARVAVAIALAAGLSWLALGGAILAATRRRPSVLAWADACLLTMGVGIAVLLVAVALNLAGRGSLSAHVLVLLASNAAMAIVFTLRARALGMRPAVAFGLWLVALDGVFALLVFGLLAVMP